MMLFFVSSCFPEQILVDVQPSVTLIKVILALVKGLWFFEFRFVGIENSLSQPQLGHVFVQAGNVFSDVVSRN